jgi:hypothetical protein
MVCASFICDMLIALTLARSALLLPGEMVVFNTTVEKSALRRRASRLLAIAGAPRRKPRELVLTDKRLICVKHKPGRTYQLSHELLLKPADGQKDSKITITSVEPKGEKEFVVLTVRFPSQFCQLAFLTLGSTCLGHKSISFPHFELILSLYVDQEDT